MSDARRIHREYDADAVAAIIQTVETLADGDIHRAMTQLLKAAACHAARHDFDLEQLVVSFIQGTQYFRERDATADQIAVLDS